MINNPELILATFTIIVLCGWAGLWAILKIKEMGEKYIGGKKKMTEEKTKSFYDHWWLWLFITIMFMTFCITIMMSEISTKAIEKGEYKIIIEAGQNFKQISENTKRVECQPVTCNCKPPETYWSPYYYEPTNWSKQHNWSIYSNKPMIPMPNTQWVKS
jgi:hypothetical protein